MVTDTLLAWELVLAGVSYERAALETGNSTQCVFDWILKALGWAPRRVTRDAVRAALGATVEAGAWRGQVVAEKG